MHVALLLIAQLLKSAFASYLGSNSIKFHKKRKVFSYFKNRLQFLLVHFAHANNITTIES